MTNGLYLFNQWVCDNRIALTLQANDLTKPSSEQASYSKPINIPDSSQIRNLLGHAEQVDAGGDHPYKYIPAKVVEDEEVIFEGLAKLTDFQGGWKGELLESKRSLFEILKEKSLRELDLRGFDHNWDIPTITAKNTLPVGIVYPLIDYGSISEGVIASDTITPAVIVKMLILQMLFEHGYRCVGEWLSDPLFNAMAIPFTEDEPKAFDENWVKDRQARVTLPEGPEIVRGGFGPFAGFGKLNRIQPFSIDGPITANFYNGRLQNYKTDSFTYVADRPMRLHVQAFQQFQARIQSGAVEIKLQVEVNGQNVAEGYWSKGGPYNLFGGIFGATDSLIKRDKIDVDTKIDLNGGDRVQIRLRCERRTIFGSAEVIFFQTSDTAFASFEPVVQLRYGDNWPVARNLPDMKCVALLHTIAFATSGWWRVDDMRMTVELIPLNRSLKLKPVDWTDRIDTGSEPVHTPKVDPYGQRNYLKWKEVDEVVKFSGGDGLTSSVPKKHYGDGVITCNAETLESDVLLFELPFSASINSTTEVVGYGKPLRIETRTVSGTGNTLNVTRKATTPRLILIEPSNLTSVSTKILNAKGAIQDVTVPLMGCWFARRPEVLATEQNAFSLAFDPVSGQYAEESLIQRYFDGLKQVLLRPRLLTVNVYLTPAQLSNLQTPDKDGVTELMRPVRVRGIRIGALEFSQSEFLINKVSDRVSGQTCAVTLIAY